MAGKYTPKPFSTTEKLLGISPNCPIKKKREVIRYQLGILHRKKKSLADRIKKAHSMGDIVDEQEMSRQMVGLKRKLRHFHDYKDFITPQGQT